MAAIFDVIERFTVQGVDKVTNAFEKVRKAVKGTGSELKDAGGKVAGFATEGLAVAAGAVGAAVGLAALTKQAYDLNNAFQQSHKSIENNLRGMTTLANVKDPGKRFADSALLANDAMNKFEKTAFQTGQPVDAITAGFERLAPTMEALRQPLGKIEEMTMDSARAGAAFGEKADVAAGEVQKLIKEGVISGDTPFSRMLQKQVGHLYSWQARMEKAKKVLKDMAKVAPEGTRDVGTNLQRLRTFFDAGLRRVGSAGFDALGGVLQKLVGWLDKNYDKVVKLATVIGGRLSKEFGRVLAAAAPIVDVVTDIASEVYQFVTTSGKVSDGWESIVRLVGQTSTGIGVLWETFKPLVESLGSAAFTSFTSVLGSIADAFEIIGVAIEEWDKPGKGMGRISELIDDMTIKLYELAHAFAGVIEKVSGDDSDVKLLEQQITLMKSELAYAKLLRYEKEHPLGGATRTPAEKVAEESEKNVKDLLSKTSGLKFKIDIGNVYINQDFRDQDPDRVLIQFTSDLERLSEAALQSAAGGSATDHGPGSAF